MNRFITSTDMLLVCTDHGRLGVEWLGHPEKTFATAADVADAFNEDETVAFRRIDLAPDTKRPGEWGVPEDVTEDVAAAYIAKFCGLSPSDAAAIPLYVKQSIAWSDFVDGYNETTEDDDYSPLDPASMRKEHGTHTVSGGRMA